MGAKQYSWNAKFPLLVLQKQTLVKEYSLFWLILVSCRLLNGQLKQQNVFIVPSLSKIVTSVCVCVCVCVCVRKLKRSASAITALLLLTTPLVKYLLVFHSVDCGLWIAPHNCNDTFTPLFTTVRTYKWRPVRTKLRYSNVVKCPAQSCAPFLYLFDHSTTDW
jgi:hypothetical protein